MVAISALLLLRCWSKNEIPSVKMLLKIKADPQKTAQSKAMFLNKPHLWSSPQVPSLLYFSVHLEIELKDSHKQYRGHKKKEESWKRFAGIGRKITQPQKGGGVRRNCW